MSSGSAILWWSSLNEQWQRNLVSAIEAPWRKKISEENLRKVLGLRKIYCDSDALVRDLEPLRKLNGLEELYLVSRLALQKHNMERDEFEQKPVVADLPLYRSCRRINGFDDFSSEPDPDGYCGFEYRTRWDCFLYDCGPPDLTRYDQVIDILYCRDSVLEPLTALGKLRKLIIGKTASASQGEGLDLRYLAHLPNLEELDISSWHLVNTASVGRCTSLKSLNISESSFGQEMTVLKDLTDLEYLNIRDLDLDSLEGLSSLSKLRILSCASNPRIADLTPIAGLTELRCLDIRECGVSSLESLPALQALRDLYVGKVRDLTPLAGISSLRRIHIDYTDNLDLGPLCHLPGLDKLVVGVSELWSAVRPDKGMEPTAEQESALQEEQHRILSRLRSQLPIGTAPQLYVVFWD